MYLMYGEDGVEVDFREGLNFPSDFQSVLDNLKPQTKLTKRYRSPTKEYVEFDMLTPREIALVNLIDSLDQYKAVMMEKLFPLKDIKMIQYAKSIGATHEMKPIEFVEFAAYQKTIALSRCADNALNLELFGRLGYDLQYTYDGSGKLYCIKDLRKLLSSLI